MKELGIIIMGLVCFLAVSYDVENFGQPDYGFSPDFGLWVAIGFVGAGLYSYGKNRKQS